MTFSVYQLVKDKYWVNSQNCVDTDHSCGYDQVLISKLLIGLLLNGISLVVNIYTRTLLVFISFKFNCFL